VATAKRSGYLERRIRARLEGFYQSPQAAELLAAVGTSIDLPQVKATVAEENPASSKRKRVASTKRASKVKPISAVKAGAGKIKHR
jgi:hypothetical protein